MVIGIFQRFPVQVVGTITLILMMVYLLSRKVLVKVYLKLACDQYYIDSERNPTGGIVGRTPNNERRYVNMAVTGIGTYSSYTNSYGNTQNAGNKTGRTYKNAHEYKNYLTQKYDCLRSRDYSVNINSSLLSKAMGDEKTKQWLEYNLSLIPESIEKLKAAQSARGCKVLSVTDVSFILCYIVLYNFLSLIFSLIRDRKLVWEDIT